MKFRLILSILFVIATTFTALHEVEHVKNHDSSTCLVCTVNNNLVSADAVQFTAHVEIFHFQAIGQESSTSYSYRKIDFNQNRAPPKIS